MASMIDATPPLVSDGRGASAEHSAMTAEARAIGLVRKKSSIGETKAASPGARTAGGNIGDVGGIAGNDRIDPGKKWIVRKKLLPQRVEGGRNGNVPADDRRKRP